MHMPYNCIKHIFYHKAFWIRISLIHDFIFSSTLYNICKLKVKVKSCPTLCNPWKVACTKLLRTWDFQGKSTGVGCHFLHQGIFPTQGSHPSLSHCRQTLYRLSHQGTIRVCLHTSKFKFPKYHLPKLWTTSGWIRLILCRIKRHFVPSHRIFVVLFISTF